MMIWGDGERPGVDDQDVTTVRQMWLCLVTVYALLLGVVAGVLTYWLLR